MSIFLIRYGGDAGGEHRRLGRRSSLIVHLGSVCEPTYSVGMGKSERDSHSTRNTLACECELVVDGTVYMYMYM